MVNHHLGGYTIATVSLQKLNKSNHVAHLVNVKAIIEFIALTLGNTVDYT